jgi:hypothetical protein
VPPAFLQALWPETHSQTCRHSNTRAAVTPQWLLPPCLKLLLQFVRSQLPLLSYSSSQLGGCAQLHIRTLLLLLPHVTGPCTAILSPPGHDRFCCLSCCWLSCQSQHRYRHSNTQSTSYNSKALTQTSLPALTQSSALSACHCCQCHHPCWAQ